MQRHWTHWIAAIVLVGSVEAQGAGPFQFTHHGSTDWPSALSSPGTITRQLAADFTGYGSKDVFLLAGGRPVFCYKPDSWEAVYPVVDTGDPTYNDMALIPGTKGQVALVGPDGLDRLFYFEPSVLNPVPIGGELVAGSFLRMNVTDDSAWQGAKLVRTGCLDSSGTELDYVALGSDDHTILVRLASSGGVTLSSFTLLETIYDIAILQWNDTAELEIALLNSYGVEVYQYSGSRIRRFARVATGTEAFCLFRKNISVNHQQVPNGRDRIAWVRQRSSGGQELVELSSPNQTVISNVVITDTDDPIVSMTGVDLKTSTDAPDGNWELVAHHLLNCEPFIYKNAGPPDDPDNPPVSSFSNSGNPNESGSTWETIDEGSLEYVAGSHTMAAPICEDLSADGKTDLFIAAWDGASTYFDLWHGGQDYGSGVLEELTGPGAYVLSAESVVGTAVPEYLPTETGVKLKLDLSVAQVPQEADILEITAWTRSTLGEYSNPIHVYYESVDWEDDFIYPVVPIGFGPNAQCYEQQTWYELRFGHFSGGTLVGLSRTYIDVVGGDPRNVTPLEDESYSTAVCVENSSICALGLPTTAWCTWDGGGSTVTGPLSMTRRRIIAPNTSGGGGSIMPVAAELTNLGAVATEP